MFASEEENPKPESLAVDPGWKGCRLRYGSWSASLGTGLRIPGSCARGCSAIVKDDGKEPSEVGGLLIGRLRTGLVARGLALCSVE